jgi:hypothetical protein
VDGAFLGSVVDGSAERAIVDICIERVVSREWKRLSERLLRHNGIGGYLGGPPVPDTLLSRGLQQFEQESMEAEHERAILLASALGHDLQNTLAAKMAFVAFVARPPADEADQARALASAVRSIRGAMHESCSIQ